MQKVPNDKQITETWSPQSPTARDNTIPGTRRLPRPAGEDVALIAADELAAILETAHLPRSPVNAERLRTALERIRKRESSPQAIDELRQAFGIQELDD